MRAGRAEQAADLDAGAADLEPTRAQPGSPVIARVLALQRQAGNRATMRALSRLDVIAAPVPTLDTTPPTTPELSLLARPRLRLPDG